VTSPSHKLGLTASLVVRLIGLLLVLSSHKVVHHLQDEMAEFVVPLHFAPAPATLDCSAATYSAQYTSSIIVAVHRANLLPGRENLTLRKRNPNQKVSIRLTFNHWSP